MTAKSSQATTKGSQVTDKAKDRAGTVVGVVAEAGAEAGEVGDKLQYSDWLAVLTALETPAPDGCLSRRELAKLIGLSESTVMERLYRAMDQGLVEAVRMPRQGYSGVMQRIIVYRLVKAKKSEE